MRFAKENFKACIFRALVARGPRDGEDPVNVIVTWAPEFPCGVTNIAIPKEVWAALGLPE